MDQTIADILEFVEENDVKFIRLAYCDLFGIQKNMAIMAGQLKKAFEEGIIFDASAVKGFQTVEHSDLFSAGWIHGDHSALAALSRAGDANLLQCEKSGWNRF